MIRSLPFFLLVELAACIMCEVGQDALQNQVCVKLSLEPQGENVMLYRRGNSQAVDV